MDTRLALAVILGVVLLIRLPFLNQAIQGDEVYYFAAAEHALIDPLHPNHVQYVFLGDRVDLRGFPHPPLNAWCLALLLAIFGDIHEVPFHAAYLLFSLVAALAMWSLAKRFSPHPLWATLLFLAVPAFVVNGNSLESDLPFLAFWMAAVACFVAGERAPAAIAMALAALAAFQAVFLTPILAVYVWLYRRNDRTAWLLTLVPPATILAWELFERLSSGTLPAAVAAGYMSSYGWQALAYKLRNAAALTVHACFMIFPALLPGAIWLASKRRGPRDRVPGRVDRVVLRRRSGGLLRRIGPVPAAHGRSRRFAGVALAAPLAGPRIRGSTGAQPVARHGELSALGWLPPLRPADPPRNHRPSHLYGWRVGLLPGSRRRRTAGAWPGAAARRYCGFEPTGLSGPIHRTHRDLRRACHSRERCRYNSSAWKRAPATQQPPKDCGRSTSPTHPSISCAPQSSSTAIPRSLTSP